LRRVEGGKFQKIVELRRRPAAAGNGRRGKRHDREGQRCRPKQNCTMHNFPVMKCEAVVFYLKIMLKRVSTNFKC
jgi:hypothetical protein